MTFPRWLAACLVALAVAGPVWAQNPSMPTMPGLPDASQQGPERRSNGDAKLDDIMRDNERKMNKQRQKDLQRDTDKLLELATQLKKYVDKSNENVLSLDVLRKCEEIEKLAHSVQSNMKGQ